MSLQFAVVHEAPADFQTATELADRVLVESIDWMEEDLIEHHRTWLRESSGVPLTWKRIKQSALDAGINAIGFFDGEPAEPDARAARRAILYLRHALPDLAGVLLIRDQDDQPERRVGLDQARRQEDGATPGRRRVGRRRAGKLGDQRVRPAGRRGIGTPRSGAAELGFDPRERSARTHRVQERQRPTQPEAGASVLSGDDRDRESRCWREAPCWHLPEAWQREWTGRLPRRDPGPDSPL